MEYNIYERNLYMIYSCCCNRLNTPHETGLLEINVMDNTVIPTSNALVSISRISYIGIYNEGAEGIVLAEFYTDGSGTIHIELPVLNELTGGNEYYSAKISKEGYYDVFIYYIQIFPNIETTYDVFLTPKTGGLEKTMYLFQPKIRRIHEH
jgi:hypothetical protein